MRGYPATGGRGARSCWSRARSTGLHRREELRLCVGRNDVAHDEHYRALVGIRLVGQIGIGPINRRPRARHIGKRPDHNGRRARTITTAAARNVGTNPTTCATSPHNSEPAA